MARCLESPNQIFPRGQNGWKRLYGWLARGNVECFFRVTLLLTLSACRMDIGENLERSTLRVPGSRDSACIDTQPRFIPPAFSEWIA